MVRSLSLDQFFLLNPILHSAGAEGSRVAIDFAAKVRLYYFDVFWCIRGTNHNIHVSCYRTDMNVQHGH